jgi:TetR/AcrR family acrAB operon transcriptional repressor
MMEIIFHKCEFVGEMAVVQQAQRSLCLESYDRIEQLKSALRRRCCLPIFTRRAVNAQLSFRPDGKLAFAPDSFDLKKKRGLCRNAA